MISILSARFRRHIALILYGIFYAQLVMAAESPRMEAPGRWKMPAYSLLSAHTWRPRVIDPMNLAPDSVIIPSAAALSRKELQAAYPGLSKVRDKRSSFFGGGPTQPEMQSFQSVNANNMVDLFSGDFSYNIPLLDVGGYPVNIAYHSGISMEEDASWVGLGWNINPGSITRNMRGLPDDFNGQTDTIKKVANIKPNLTWGVNVGDNFEVFGLPSVTLGAGIFHSTYNGWGTELTMNASIDAGIKSFGTLTGGLAIKDNSQSGLTLNPSLSARFATHNASNTGGALFGVNLSAPYNSRTGLKEIGLGLSAKAMGKNKNNPVNLLNSSGGISFNWPAYNPTITLPMTNYNFSFTAKVGGAATGWHPNLFLSGYVSKEYVAASDTSISLPAFGYLNFQNKAGNLASVTDFNREKDMPYRESPPIPHIAIPSYTYDVFSISGEGTGGSFRAYRGDIGFVADPLVSSKAISGAASIDLGGGNILHGGVDLNANYSVTRSGPWLSENPLSNTIKFRNSNGLFEAAYFRNPGEKTINTTAFYNAIGGDNVAVASLYQAGNSSPSTIATNNLTLFNGKKLVGTVPLDSSKVIRQTRDKRSEVISYLTASEASIAGLDKSIYSYAVNHFSPRNCNTDITDESEGKGTGFLGYYYWNMNLQGKPAHIRQDTVLYFNWGKGNPFHHSDDGVTVLTDNTPPLPPGDRYSVRWLGRLKAPATGPYTFGIFCDDGVRFWLNDSLLIPDWEIQGHTWDTVQVNLVGGHMYNLRLEYFENRNDAFCQLAWRRPDRPDVPFDIHHRDTIPKEFCYPPLTRDMDTLSDNLVREDRVNSFRRGNHISEIDVLNPDGRKYVYGIPVYNLIQKEVSFSVEKDSGRVSTGLTAYTDKNNSPFNSSGKDGYYSREEVPAYAHSFLLTGILSPDYVDITGNGISDDDIGDAVKFNYSKTSGISNPFGWRAPYITDSANYNEGMRSYDRDDKAHYIYGTKELWYLNSIESKSMIATFTLQPRADLLEANERGHKINNGKAMCLKQIDLYSKADFMDKGVRATPIKTVHFEYSYELCRGINAPLPLNDSGKLTLKRIWFTYNGNNKGALNPYVFNYHPNNPRYKVSSSDKWGTYKDASQNPGYTTGNPVTNAEYPYSIQDSVQAAYNAGAWTLDSIQLPSGGRIKVDYESDDYAFVQNRRSTQMCKIVGFGVDSNGSYIRQLYGSSGEGLYAYVRIPYAVSSRRELYARYLDGIGKLYFRLNVKMPTDDFGSGSEYIPCYADPDVALKNWYGPTSDPHIIWIKIRGVNSTGNGDGILSPMAQTAINFLRLNLPSKAFPGSEFDDDITFVDGLKIIVSMVSNITDLLTGVNTRLRVMGWARDIDTNRSFVRLDCPVLKKYGGGLRVKSILIYDNWNNMTRQKESVYGQTYEYTTTRSINGVETTISSGVASWEPGIGGEENPFHLPIEYVEKSSIIGPATTLYSEEPLGEAFYPGASVGYSNVKMRSIHTTKARSANGLTETSFYTSYDFPTSWDWSSLDGDTKKRFKPLLSNFLRINVRNYLTISQGFKVELNDMNGKMRKEAVYAETDLKTPITYTENFYKVDNPKVEFKHLNNTVYTVDPYGNIDTAATIGKDAELMADMRDQTATTIGGNISVNADMFAAGILPIVIPTLMNLYQQETTRFRSAGLMKVIQRYGILDSVVHMDKGSLVSSKNILYDSETGDPVLIRTGNEFNDSLYEFTYPAHWAYKGMGPAYQNIDVLLSHLTINAGKITGITAPENYLTAGDELLVYSKLSIDSVVNCSSTRYSYFSDPYKLWVIDTNALHGGNPALFVVDQYGSPFTGNDVTLKVIRSGYRNQNSSIGSISSFGNPIVPDGAGSYHLVFDSTMQVVTANASEMRQYWKVSDKRATDSRTTCVYTAQDSAMAAAESCSCLAPFFQYLIKSRRLFTRRSFFFNKTVGSLVNDANAAGANIVLANCPLLSANANLPFYALTFDTLSNSYRARLGDDILEIHAVSGGPVNFFRMTAASCDSMNRALFKDPTLTVPAPEIVTTKIYPNFSVNLLSSMGSSCPSSTDTLLTVDTVSDHILVENSLDILGYSRNAASVLRFDGIESIPKGVAIVSAKLILQADQRGHLPGLYNNANSLNPDDSVGYSLSAPPGWFPYYPLDTLLYQAYYSPFYAGVKNRTAFQNDTIDVAGWLDGYFDNTYYSRSFILTQGSGPLNRPAPTDSSSSQVTGIPPYLMSGYSNYYATFYSQRYADSSKWPAIVVSYIKPTASIDTMGAVLVFNSTVSCNTVTGRTCYSSITDTVVNPYQYGILGDFRPQRSYVYYGRRMQSDPTQPTNIRKDGVISRFAPFWTLQAGEWAPSYDTTRWVWNSQSTLFNRKGFELENKDPLGRYNTGQYGYGLTLPTAVVQNSRYEESAFEGFEDYGYIANTCDTACAETRSFDFSTYRNNISDSMSHTGLYSLRVGTGEFISLPVPIQAVADTSDPQLRDSVHSDICGISRLNGVRATSDIILPPFRPFAGKRMLLGAWVKEKNACTCRSYSRDHIQLTFGLSNGDSSNITLSPSGNIIEGWQRYEAVFTIPANANEMVLTLQASDSSTTYFDDIRLHPFNGEMKSYVYNPINLRLMAELDDNNYGTFYEYDDDGTLIRVKKETERGIQTIKETRSALLKDQ